MEKADTKTKSVIRLKSRSKLGPAVTFGRGKGSEDFCGMLPSCLNWVYTQNEPEVFFHS